MTRTASCAVLGALLASCSLPLDPPAAVIQARFDPTAGVIPTPNDLLRNEDEGHLELPITDGLSPAERAFREWFNTKDGWSTTQPAQVRFTGPIEGASIDDESVQVWRWSSTPVEVDGLTRVIDEAGTTLSIDPPERGWERGATYVVLVRGRGGLRGEEREVVECDAPFYFLRQRERLDVPAHQRAFPGATRAERMESARRLEAIRQDLAPMFEFFEARGVARDQVASLWSFTTSEHVELAMDRASQRMPLPFDLLVDPRTQRIELPIHHEDNETVREAKTRLREWDGWALSASVMFEVTADIDPASVTAANLELYELSTPPRRIPAEVRIYQDRRHLGLVPGELLRERTTYGVVVRDGLRGMQGGAIEPMVLGHLLRTPHPVAVDGVSQLSVLDDESAARVETNRQEVAPLLEHVGRRGVVTAWTFTTQSVTAPLQEAIDRATALAPPAAPRDVERRSPLQALTDFPLGISSLLNVGDVYEGTLELPTYLDARTRQWRTDGEHTMREVAFLMTVPRNARGPLPVVIFGHGVVCERRFVLALGDAFARRGFAAISIDFPFHGKQTYCLEGGPISLPNPQTGDITTLPPCRDGSHCDEYGRCVDDQGAEGNHLRQWPVLNFPFASGAAFIEVDHIANTRDHFMQAVVDLSQLSRSIREADWSPVVGVPLADDRVYYAGQSLGGIIGATFVAMSPEVERAVLNVPGADLVDMFYDSTYFGPHIQAAFVRFGVTDGTWQSERFLNIARVFVDAVDPQSYAHLLRERDVFVQMALIDPIIPNEYTELLARLSEAPRRDYVGEHGFVVIPVEPAYLRGSNEMADFLEGSFRP